MTPHRHELSGEEWAVLKPLLPRRRNGGRRNHVCLRDRYQVSGLVRPLSHHSARKLSDAPAEDMAFLIRRYFPGQAPPAQPVSDNDRYLPRKAIAAIFCFRPRSVDDGMMIKCHGVPLQCMHFSTAGLPDDLHGLLTQPVFQATNQAIIQAQAPMLG